MKLIKLALLTSIFVVTSAMSMTAKVEKPTLVQGTSIGKYNKPGAPVDITYTIEHVNVGETSQVQIVLSSVLTSGKMYVTIKVDKDLREVLPVKKHMTFTMKAGQKEYPFVLEVSAEKEGLYYVRLIVTMPGKGMRAFAVPVPVGNAKRTTRSQKVIEKTPKGENIHVSPAQETIQR